MTTGGEDPRSTAVRIESLIAELGTSPDARMRAASEDLVRQLMQLYGACLERVMDLTYEHDEAAAAAIFERWADDPLVASLLALHGLHPHPVEDRIARALDRVSPIVAAAGATLTLIAIDEDSIRLRIGTEQGVASAAANLRPLVERAIAEAAPEIRRLEFEGEPENRPLLQITWTDGRPIALPRGTGGNGAVNYGTTPDANGNAGLQGRP